MNNLIIYQVMRILAAQPCVELLEFKPPRPSKHNKKPQRHCAYKQADYSRLSVDEQLAMLKGGK